MRRHLRTQTLQWKILWYHFLDFTTMGLSFLSLLLLLLLAAIVGPASGFSAGSTHHGRSLTLVRLTDETTSSVAESATEEETPTPQQKPQVPCPDCDLCDGSGR